MEHLEGIHLFAGADEFQRFFDHGTDRDGGTTSGITVEFCQYDTVKIETIIKLLSRVDCILTGHRVHHKEGLARMDGSFDGRDFLHHLFIYGQTTRSIDDNRINMFVPCVLDGVFGNLYRIFVALFGVNLHTDLLTQDLQLFDGCRSIDVASNQQYLTSFFAFDQVGQFARKGGLTGTLQTGNQHNGRVAFQLDVGHGAAHQCRQLIAYDLGHHLTRLDGLENILSQCFGLHLVSETLGNLIIDIGIDQRTPNLFEAFGYIDLGDTTLALEDLK